MAGRPVPVADASSKWSISGDSRFCSKFFEEFIMQTYLRYVSCANIAWFRPFKFWLLSICFLISFWWNDAPIKCQSSLAWFGHFRQTKCTPLFCLLGLCVCVCVCVCVYMSVNSSVHCVTAVCSCLKQSCRICFPTCGFRTLLCRVRNPEVRNIP